MADSNHHAYVVPVVPEPHPDPETTRLSVVRVNAYTCVIATEDWKGIDKAIYIQPDTVVPDTPEFAFLKTNKSARAELEKLAPTLTPEDYKARLDHIVDSEAIATHKLRITAVRLRGVQSFGMLWPTTECPLCDAWEKAGQPAMAFAPLGSDVEGDRTFHFIDGLGEEWPCLKTAKVGDDVWKTMSLTRYEPPIPLGAGDSFDRSPDLPWLHEYDVENYYNWPNVLVEGEEVIATEKIDGTNSRYTWAPDRETGEYRMFVGGKSAWFADTPTSLYWRAFRANPWIMEFCKAHPDWTLYGETFGNVQKLKYGVGENQPNMIRLFDALAINAFIDYEELEKLFTEKQRVPLIYRGPWDAEKFKALSLGNSTLAKHLKEGIVIAPVKERIDLALGRVKLKIVSFDLLSKSTRK
jgi:RNA ligase (TIGR02306 family)